MSEPNAVKTALLNFARARADILFSLPAQHLATLAAAELPLARSGERMDRKVRNADRRLKVSYGGAKAAAAAAQQQQNAHEKASLQDLLRVVWEWVEEGEQQAEAAGKGEWGRNGDTGSNVHRMASHRALSALSLCTPCARHTLPVPPCSRRPCLCLSPLLIVNPMSDPHRTVTPVHHHHRNSSTNLPIRAWPQAYSPRCTACCPPCGPSCRCRPTPRPWRRRAAWPRPQQPRWRSGRRRRRARRRQRRRRSWTRSECRAWGAAYGAVLNTWAPRHLAGQLAWGRGYGCACGVRRSGIGNGDGRPAQMLTLHRRTSHS